MRHLVSLIVLAGLLPGTSAAPADTVAEVDGIAVTRAQVLDRCMREFGAPLVDRLVNQQIVRLEAKRRGVTATPAEVEARVSALKSQYLQRPEGATEWKTFVDRYSLANLRKDYEVAVLTEKIGKQEAAAASLTPAEMDAVRAAVKREATTFSVRNIMVGAGREYGGRTRADALARANEAMAKLKAGAGWDELAKEYSDDASTRMKGGLCEPFALGTLHASFEQAVKGLQPGGTTPTPVQTSQGYHIIQLVEKQTAPVTEGDFQKALAAELQRRKSVLSDPSGMGWFSKARGRYRVETRMPWENGTS